MIYKEDYEEKYKKLFIPMYMESKKKNPDYTIVYKVPSQYRYDAIRYSFPTKVDLAFAVLLFIAVFAWMYCSDFKQMEYSIRVLGSAAVVYGALFAFVHDLAYKGPKIKSLKYLRAKNSRSKTAVNIINTFMFWLFVAVAMQGIAGVILVTLNYVVYTLFSGGFAFLFYKTRF